MRGKREPEGMRVSGHSADNLIYVDAASIPACFGMMSARPPSPDRKRTRNPSKGLRFRVSFQETLQFREATFRTNLAYHQLVTQPFRGSTVSGSGSLPAQPHLAPAILQ